MAQYRLEKSIIQRSEGQSAVASAAYRSRTRIHDERLDKTFDWSDREDLLHSEIMLPEGAPERFKDRGVLWNELEKKVRRKDGQLAYDFTMNLPHELDAEDGIELARKYLKERYVDAGNIADLNIHDAPEEGDNRNIHAHVMVTMREITREGFGKQHRMSGREFKNADEVLKAEREAWAEYQNLEFERRGLDVRVSAKSYQDQGIDREPGQHMGADATRQMRRQEQGRIAGENDEIERENTRRAQLHAKVLETQMEFDRQMERFGVWVYAQQDGLKARQQLTAADLANELKRQKDQLKQDIEKDYTPHLKTVQGEITAIRDRIKIGGVWGFIRKVTGRNRGDSRRQEDLQKTVAATQAHIQGMREKVQERNRERLAALERFHAQERQDQQGRLEKASERKSDALAGKIGRAADKLQRQENLSHAAAPSPARSYLDRYKAAEETRKASEEPQIKPERENKRDGPEHER